MRFDQNTTGKKNINMNYRNSMVKKKNLASNLSQEKSANILSWVWVYFMSWYINLIGLLNDNKFLEYNRLFF